MERTWADELRSMSATLTVIREFVADANAAKGGSLREHRQRLVEEQER